MTQRDPGVYLEDIEYYASAAKRFLAGATLDQYLADETQGRVERVLELCGEAINNLNKIAHRRDLCARALGRCADGIE